jgi:uncharacterized protein (TIGR03086 family)
VAAEPLVDLADVLDLAETLIGGVSPEQAAQPTPCQSWDVAALVAHMVHDTAQFAAAAGGDRPDWSTPTPTIAGNAADAFRTGAAELRSAWQGAGDLSAEIELPIGRVQKSFVANQQIAEFAVHSWDLATATGQRVRFPEHACTAALDWARVALRPQFRGDEGSGKAFGWEVPIPDDAPIEDRLAAFFGRHPQDVTRT